MTPITALGSRYGIQGALGRSVKRASSASTWWDLNGTITSCIAAYQAKGAANYAASLVNLNNPGTNNATDSASPSWTSANGWQFNGTDQYLTTVIITGACAVIVRYSGCLGYIFGGSTAYYYPGVNIVNQWETFYQCHYSNVKGGDLDKRTGIAAIVGATGNAGVGYFNGSPQVSSLGTHTANSASFIGRKWTNNWGSGYVQAAAYYNTTLSEAQISNLTTAMAAL